MYVCIGSLCITVIFINKMWKLQCKKKMNLEKKLKTLWDTQSTVTYPSLRVTGNDARRPCV